MKRHFLLVTLLAVLCMGCNGVTIESPNLSPRPPANEEVVVPEEPTPEPAPTREVLFFTQRGCPPCEQAKPQVDGMREQGLTVTEVWYHEHPELFRQYGVTSTPTFIVLEEGVEIERTSDIVLLVTILVKILSWILPLILG